jgi:small subunit ribosomal protein S7
MRKGKAKKRYIMPDPKYNNTLAAKFINCLMKEGKKNLAYKIFYDSIEIVSEKTNEKGLDIWKKALNNIMPHVEVKKKRIGGATFQVPIEVRPERKISLGIKWLIYYSRLRSENTMKEKLANEIISASKGDGNAVKKKTDIHKMAESNKAFSHFRF